MQGISPGQRLRRMLASGAVVAAAGVGTAFAYGALAEPEGASSGNETLAEVAALSGGSGELRAVRQAAVLVCQATGDGSYVTIRVLPERLDEYRQNPNNIVPAPAGGCPERVGGGGGGSSTTQTTPSATQTTPSTTQTTTPTRTQTTPRPTPTRTQTTTRPQATTPTPTRTQTTPARPTPTRTQTTPTRTTTTPRPATSTETDATPAPSTTSTTPTPSSGTAGASTSGSSSSPGTKRSSQRRFTGRMSGDLSRLPNTGNDETALLLLGGLALLMAGTGLHLRHRPLRF